MSIDGTNRANEPGVHQNSTQENDQGAAQATDQASPQESSLGTTQAPATGQALAQAADQGTGQGTTQAPATGQALAQAADQGTGQGTTQVQVTDQASGQTAGQGTTQAQAPAKSQASAAKLVAAISNGVRNLASQAASLTKSVATRSRDSAGQQDGPVASKTSGATGSYSLAEKSIMIVAGLLFILTCLSTAYLLNLSLWFSLLAILLLGGLMLAQHRYLQDDIAKAAERTSLLLLIIVSIAVSWKALWPLLYSGDLQVEKSSPLLFATAALYIFYFLLNQNTLAEKGISLQNRLTGFFSGPPLILTAIVSLIITSYALIALHFVQLHYSNFAWLADKFLDRGLIPPITVFLFFWCIMIIANKTYIITHERLVLSSNWAATQKSVLLQAWSQNTKSATSADADNFIDLIWKKSAEFYIIPSYINWSIPILGFIGTVLGISLAADGIQHIISSNQGFSQLSAKLGDAISPLGIAFDTTLIALSLSVLLMLFQTALQKRENNLLIDCENRIRNVWGNEPGSAGDQQ